MNKKIFTFSIIPVLTNFCANGQKTTAIVDINGGYINIMGTTLNVPDYTKWYYFSFETGSIVGSSDFILEDVENNIGTEIPNAEWTTRTDWDIAFHATDIRTNNAEAILIADATSITPLDEVYADLTEAPESGYSSDEMLSGTFISSMAAMPPLRATTMSGCVATHGWAVFSSTGGSTNPSVVVFKLTNGKYVKVYLKEFFNEENKPGYINIEYKIIPAAALGINNYENININIYPNPVSDVLNIELSEKASFIIYNIIGVIVKESLLYEGRNEIPVSDLPAGTYFIKSNDNTKKFIIK